LVIDLEVEKLSGMKVLMVDDSPTSLDILGHIMGNWGLDISVVTDGQQAINSALENKPDLILLEVRLPRMNGYKVCEILKQDDRTKAIPVIFVSVLTESDDVVKAFAVGGNDYIKKPFEEKEVLARIGTHLSLKKANSEKEQLIKDLDALSRIDLLTKLSNRIDIIEKLEYESSKFERYSKDFSVILCHVDRFKAINDQHGHATGDYVLKEVADVLSRTARKIDHVARWGGGEFLTVLAETKMLGAILAADKLKEAVESHKFEVGTGPLQVTMSFGVSNYAGSGEQIDGLIKVADEFVSKAKGQGGNCVVSM
jgi:diguanylate cyclase (GGDEF)-like protein